MDSTTTKNCAEEIGKALKGVFQKFSLTPRKRAWEKLMTKEGKKEIETLLLHPNKPTNKIRGLNFKEWIK